MPIINASTGPISRLEGAEHEATISLILDRSDPGQGPRLHRHPYDETWVIRTGQLTFQLGDQRLRAGPGEIVIAPRVTPHKFTNNGSGLSSLVCIHANPRIIGEWLE